MLLIGKQAAHALYGSVCPLPPTESQLREERLEDHALFRHISILSGKVAWRQIGTFPTPIHVVQASAPNGVAIQFYVKREDLSSPIYGGNKVRTLQHQLASCEAHKEHNDRASFCVMGSPGSNQVVATKAHARVCNIEASSIRTMYVFPDEPDMDNTLNVLSALSMGSEVVLSNFMAGRRRYPNPNSNPWPNPS